MGANIGAHIYLKQILTELKEEINRNTIIARDFNTPFPIMDKSSKQKINSETVDLDQMELTDIFRAFHSQQKTHSFQVHMGHLPG